MDTNDLDINGLPSAEELQRLANDYFNAPPATGLGFSPGQFQDQFQVGAGDLRGHARLPAVHPAAGPDVRPEQGRGGLDHQRRRDGVNIQAAVHAGAVREALVAAVG